ncbi:MAG: caspase family protein, partial [Pseudomonadota bacterium]
GAGDGVDIGGNTGAFPGVGMPVPIESQTPAPSPGAPAVIREPSDEPAAVAPVEEDPDADAGMVGKAALKAPGVMMEAEPYFIDAIVGVLEDGADAEELETELRDAIGAVTDSETVDVVDLDLAPVITATMRGNAFDIEATTPERQLVQEGVETRWNWSVTPRRTGKFPLTVTFETEVEGPGGEMFPRVLKTINRTVEVESLDTLFVTEDDTARDLGISDLLDGPTFDSSTEVTEEQTDAEAPPTTFAGAPSDESCIADLGEGDTKLALLVTNQAYLPEVGALENVYADGAVLSDALTELGFKVDVCADLGAREFKRTLSAFNLKIMAAKDAGTQPDVFVYYSGHGAALEGDLAGNYLIPVDLEDVEPFVISQDAIRLDAIMGGLTASGAGTIFVVSDACRNVIRSRGNAKGFQPVGFRMRTQFMFGYATDWGDVALDNGHYARALANAMLTVDGPAEMVFNQVQEEVAQATGDSQRPRYEDGLTRGYRFQPAP